MALPVVTLHHTTHRGNAKIGLKFRYNRDLLTAVKSIPNAYWSQSKTLWLLPDTEYILLTLHDVLEGKAIIDETPYRNTRSVRAQKYQAKTRILTPSQRALLNDYYLFLKGKRYSKSTLKTYTSLVADFIAFHGDVPLEALNNTSVDRFIEGVIVKRRLAISTQRQFISAMKTFIAYKPELGIDDLELIRPKRSKRLPVVLSKQEVIYLLQKTPNLKHRVILMLLYSCGLRISELLHLRTKDIDLDRRQLYLHQSKGRKDRYVGLAKVSMPLLLNYINTYEPMGYFIKGLGGKPYNASSVRSFLRRSCEAAGISKHVTPHTLRHSYATHLLEQGVDIRYIQTLLGHARPETTMIYTHVQRQDILDIKNPLDVAVERLEVSDKSDVKLRLSRKYKF